MRLVILSSLAFIIGVGALAACNSKEAVISQLPITPAQQTPAPQNPADAARRITAEELHKLWEKGEVLVVDTRGEPDFKASHIPGAILIPAGTMAGRIDELPRNKMIVAYCT